MFAFTPGRRAASVCGLSPRHSNILFYLILAMAIALAIRSAGTMLAVPTPVPPVAGALLATRRLPAAHLLSVALAVAGTRIGLIASFTWDR